ncbi:MAG: TIGR04551 family protein [Myxococcales bacterium]|nr:TIGR04551 family protein [Myxococcales bacterium]MCB9544982.1 TIGR04551 family protein [Myxococcales bacterium]
MLRLSFILTLVLAPSAFAQAPDTGDVDEPPPAAGEKGAKPVTKPKAPDPEQPGALADKIREAAGGEPAAGGDSGLPDWAPAPDAIQPVDDRGQPLDEREWAATRDLSVGHPFIESHGYMRMRMDMFHNFDLDTYSLSRSLGTSPVLPPLTEIDQQGSNHPEQKSHRYRRGADTLAGANIRFRFDPTLHVNESLRIRTTMDILDNLVLGSTPDGSPRAGFSRPDVSIETFSGSQRPPESGVSGYQDSVRVKRVWGEWRNPLGLTLFGRMGSHWGLGLLANSGNCLDCDFGDNVDRLMHVTKLFDTYLALAWDFPAEGFVGQSGLHTNANQPFGQAHDFDQRDDVNQWVVAIFDRPMSKAEQAIRVEELNGKRKPVFDWGVYNVIRTQPFSSEVKTSVPPSTASDVYLVDAKAFAYIPDLWLSWEYRPRARNSYKLQFEAVGVFGVIEEVPHPAILGDPKVVCVGGTSTDLETCEASGGDLVKQRRRDIQQWGYALEFNARNDQLEWGFQHGAASGDKSPGFGVLDKFPIDPDAEQPDTEVTGFKFDRDYVIDLILFREIIGAVTNAFYVKPWLAYNFIDQDGPDGLQEEKWGFKLAAIYAQALEAKATPGREAPLGLEFDLELYIDQKDTFRWSLAYGLLFPLGAFDRLNDDFSAVEKEPNVAQTLQMGVGLQF